jgi:hypothetical protein
MTAPRRQHEGLDRCTSTSSHAADVWHWLRDGGLTLRCASAQTCENERAGKEDAQATTVSVRRLHIGQLGISVVSVPIRGRPVTDIRFSFETLQHDHDVQSCAFANEGPLFTRQEFAEERDHNVLMAYGRCLRPALYSSLRSSPSHPTGVSALRVTIAIANARKQSELRKSTAKSRRPFEINRPPTDVFGWAL